MFRHRVKAIITFPKSFITSAPGNDMLQQFFFSKFANKIFWILFFWSKNILPTDILPSQRLYNVIVILSYFLRRQNVCRSNGFGRNVVAPNF
jgi:hypothetical protein